MAAASSDGAAVNGVAIVPSNATVLPATRGIYVGGDGNVHIQWVGGSQGNSVFVCTAGTTLPVRAIKVWSTSTTATNLIALY